MGTESEEYGQLERRQHCLALVTFAISKTAPVLFVHVL